jgi:hypothetical protein
METHKRKQMWVYEDKWVELHQKIERLEHQLNYMTIEANTDHNRWLSALEELHKVRQQLKEKQQ